ncbi:HCP-like protein [Ramaria rubella]|nr:HCP-like protein [Ramaria rubella]
MASQDRSCRKSRGRRATWVAFCLVALSVTASASLPDRTETTESAATTDAVAARDHVPAYEAPDSPEKEASIAHFQALQTLSALTAAPTQISDPYSHSSSHSTSSPSVLSSFLGSLFPTPNQRGPIATALRIAQRLGQQSWTPRPVLALFGLGSGSPGKGSSGRGRKNEEMRGRAIKIVDLLEHAVELGNVDALYTLGRVSLFPPQTLPLNVTRAYQAFERHARLTGNATSISIMAFFHGTGYSHLLTRTQNDEQDRATSLPVDQARALVYYTFAAQMGDYGSQMALGYRHWTGIGVNEDCMVALDWYEAAAEQAMAHFLSGPPGGRTLPLTHTKLSDLVGGVYGPGASVASTGLHANRHVIKAANARAAGETWEDVLDYYQFNADRGEIEFAYRLGKIYYQGSVYPSIGGIASGAEGIGAVPRDYHRARSYFLRIARLLWPHAGQGNRKTEVDDQTTIFAAQSACYLGRMLLRGEGVQQDFKLAKLWFDRGAEFGDRECHNGLGIMWRDGLGVKRDEAKAVANFGIAAGQDLAEAQVNMGKYHYNRGELTSANTYFDAAMRHGSPFEAYYYIASLHASRAQDAAAPPEMRAGSCPVAVSFFKLVAERGCWKEDLLAEAEALWRTGEEKRRTKIGFLGSGPGGETTREHEEAMLRWFLAAERGYEIAQNNLAWVLDQDKSSLRQTRFVHAPSNETARVALTQWTRSAAQRNVDALIKVGDYYFYGLGVSDEPESIRWEKAAGYYHSAVATQVSALAMWNLGWMYENGVGVTQDFYLAKRYYDMALETNSEAYFPVMLSLIKLHLRSLWYELWGGKSKGVSLWREAGDDDHWYLGKAKEDRERRLKSRKVGLDAARGGAQEDGAGIDHNIPHEEDPVQWARDRRDAEEGSGDFGPEDYFDSAMRGRRDVEEEDDELLETMFLVLLCALVSGLIYLRGRWVERRRREDQDDMAPGGDPPGGGLFPAQGDPARGDWAILR